MRADELWFSSKPLAVLARTALTPASWLYSFGWRCYALTYRLGFKKARRPHSPIVCIGNLVVGGTGKSPTTLAVAKILLSQGRQVVVGLSGYGSPRAEAATVAPHGPLNAAEWGDEPAMVRWLLPEVPLIVGRRRVLAAELAHRHFPGAVLLMDDGLQHLPLAKDVKLLLDSQAPANARCVPAGPYREPRASRNQADLIFGEQFQLQRSKLTFQDPTGAQSEPPKEANILCALGQPQGFLDALATSGVKPLQTRLLPDHDPLTEGNLFGGLSDKAPVVVTAKDWVKLRDRSDLNRPVLIAMQTVAIQPEAEFAAWLEARLADVRKT